MDRPILVIFMMQSNVMFQYFWPGSVFSEEEMLRQLLGQVVLPSGLQPYRMHLLRHSKDQINAASIFTLFEKVSSAIYWCCNPPNWIFR